MRQHRYYRCLYLILHCLYSSLSPSSSPFHCRCLYLIPQRLIGSSESFKLSFHHRCLYLISQRLYSSLSAHFAVYPLVFFLLLVFLLLNGYGFFLSPYFISHIFLFFELGGQFYTYSNQKDDSPTFNVSYSEPLPNDAPPSELPKRVWALEFFPCPSFLLFSPLHGVMTSRFAIPLEQIPLVDGKLDTNFGKMLQSLGRLSNHLAVRSLWSFVCYMKSIPKSLWIVQSRPNPILHRPLLVFDDTATVQDVFPFTTPGRSNHLYCPLIPGITCTPTSFSSIYNKPPLLLLV